MATCKLHAGLIVLTMGAIQTPETLVNMSVYNPEDSHIR